MSFFSRVVRSLTAICFVALFSPQIAAAYDRTSKWWFQGDLEAGFQQVDPSVANELSKSGLLLGGRGLLEYRSDGWGNFGVGLGIQQTWQNGESDVRIQKYILRSVFTDASYLYPLASRFFEVGWLVRNQLGEGARFDFFGSMDKIEALITTGPQVRFNFSAERWDWVVGAAALKAINSNNRTIWNFPVYVGLSIPISMGNSSSSTATLSAANSVKTETKRDVESALTEKNISAILFALDRADLSAKDQDYLVRISRVLIENQHLWGSISITGHTDLTGERGHNQNLSQRRANAVKKMFVTSGVPAKRIKAVGVGSERLLSDVSAQDGRQRRAEISIQGLSGTKLVEALSALSIEE